MVYKPDLRVTTGHNEHGWWARVSRGTKGVCMAASGEPTELQAITNAVSYVLEEEKALNKFTTKKGKQRPIDNPKEP